MVKNVQKLHRGARNGGRRWRSFAKNWWRDETVKVSAFHTEKTEKLMLGLRGQTLLNVGAEGSDVKLSRGSVGQTLN